MQVLALVACGLPNARIAVDLGLSETTAKSRANRILTRPALEKRVQATPVRPPDRARRGHARAADGGARPLTSVKPLTRPCDTPVTVGGQAHEVRRAAWRNKGKSP
ncbi:LuxR C-terminal-related transcriptional regulator [Streptomyces sp. NPDC046942]|uniref:LuxR C-terminal-related transcriptional regulator n=1 Tax=Streptomyces sp. NPDC046942 TaxID=3155137 RepID=UPI0033C49A26